MSALAPPVTKPLPVIQFCPHAGLEVPTEIVDSLLLDPGDIYNDADLWANQHFDFAHPDLTSFVPNGYTLGTLDTVKMAVARVLIDANRRPLLDDNPDGAVKMRTSYGKPIYRQPLAPAMRQRLFERYYLDYHRRAQATLAQYLDQAKLLLDCHNMAQIGPTTYAFAGQPRPLLCLANGGDRDGRPMADLGRTACSPELLHFAAEVGRQLFCDLPLLDADPAAGIPADVPTVMFNWPFRSGHIMRSYSRIGNPDYTVPTIMIEVNRGLFVGNQTKNSPVAPPNLERIAQVRRRLYQLTARIVEFINEHERQKIE